VNKKKQKNFVSFRPVAVSTPREAEQKFFAAARGGLLFFQKRTSFFLRANQGLPFFVGSKRCQ
jgi:hypothetical protein